MSAPDQIENQAATNTVAALWAARELAAKMEIDLLKKYPPALGASRIGGECRRELWYGFRWFADTTLPPRNQARAKRGLKEEAVLAADLRAAGCKVTNEQARYSDPSGHAGATPDAVVLGLKEAPAVPHVIDFKLMNAVRWRRMVREGVASAEPKIHAQITLGGYLAGTAWAGVLAVNSDTDELHLARISVVETFAQALLGKADAVVYSDAPPPRIAERPIDHRCRQCAAAPQCWAAAPPALVSCRSCRHAVPLPAALPPVTELMQPPHGGRWACVERGGMDLHRALQLNGCHAWAAIPEAAEC